MNDAEMWMWHVDACRQLEAIGGQWKDTDVEVWCSLDEAKWAITAENYYRQPLGRPDILYEASSLEDLLRIARLLT